MISWLRNRYVSSSESGSKPQWGPILFDLVIVLCVLGLIVGVIFLFFPKLFPFILSAVFLTIGTITVWTGDDFLLKRSAKKPLVYFYGAVYILLGLATAVFGYLMAF